MILLLVVSVLQIATVDAGLQPTIAQSYTSETVPDISVESALQGIETFAEGDRYYYNRVHLDGDGQPEVLVQVSGRWVCGTGGCPLFVLKRLASVCRRYGGVAWLGLQSWLVIDEQTAGMIYPVAEKLRMDPEHHVGQPRYYAVLRFDGAY